MLPTKSWRVEFDERAPIYQQIIDRFCRSLVRGELAPGERILSIRELAMDLQVNTNTVQRAYQEMERKNMIFSKRGTGYFIVNDPSLPERMKQIMVRETTSRFVSEMNALGFTDEQILSELKAQLQGEEKEHATYDNQGA